MCAIRYVSTFVKYTGRHDNCASVNLLALRARVPVDAAAAQFASSAAVSSAGMIPHSNIRCL